MSRHGYAIMTVTNGEEKWHGRLLMTCQNTHISESMNLSIKYNHLTLSEYKATYYELYLY